METAAATLIMLVGVTSYLVRNESVVTRDQAQIVQMAAAQNDYQLAQKLYEQEKIHGAVSDNSNVETSIYPQKRIAAEITRVEGLLALYPTYPPLLSQLMELNNMAGNKEAAQGYEKELLRLNVNTQ